MKEHICIVENFKFPDVEIIRVSYPVGIGFLSINFKYKEVNGKIISVKNVQL